MSLILRHAWLWPQAQAWPDLLRQISDPAHGQFARIWAERDLPLVLARPHPLVAAEPEWRLGLALPTQADGSKPRCGLQLAQSHLRTWREALLLNEVESSLAAQSAAPDLRPLQILRQAFADADLPEPRLYGSWAWQAVSGLPYLHPASDLDILCTLRDSQQLHHLCHLLPQVAQVLQQTCGRGLDGEIRLATQDIAWREYLQVREQGERGQILVKQMQGLALRTCAQVLAEWELEREQERQLSAAQQNKPLAGVDDGPGMLAA